MRSFTPLLIVLFSFLMVSAHGFALDPKKEITQYVHDSWGLEDGLPQISVQAIIQTSDGYLWLGTQEGLVRFDGNRFHVYHKNNEEKLANNGINALCEDSERNLRIGTNNGLTSIKSGEFFCHRGVLHDKKVTAIFEDSQNNIWFGTQDSVIRLKNNEFTPFPASEEKSFDGVNAIHEDRAGNIFVGTRHGLYVLEKDRFAIYTTHNELARTWITSVFEDKKENLWFGTRNGLYRLYPGTKKSETYTTATGEGLTDNWVQAIYEDRDGNLWIGTSTGGLNRLKNGKFTALTTEEGLTDDNVLCIFEDREFNLWIGTFNGGLNRLKNGKFTTFSTEEGLAHESVWTVFEDRAQNIWVGSNGGLNRLQKREVSGPHAVSEKYSEQEHLSNRPVRSLYVDSKGILWAGIWGDGLNYLENGVFKTYPKTGGRPADDFIRCIYEDDSNLWVGTNGGGLNRLVYNEKNKYYTFAANYIDLDGDIVSNNIMVVLEDRGKRLWLGTEKGLRLLDHNEKYKNEYAVTTPEEIKELSGKSVYCLYKDNEGSLWIGTNDGLYRLKEEALFPITTKNGLFNDYILALLEDDNGSFWISCYKGIFRVSKKELNDFCDGKADSVTCITYNENDGLKSRECCGSTYPNAWKSQDGQLWFATVKGVVVADPRNIEKEDPPPVTIEEIFVDGKKRKSAISVHDEPIVLEPGDDRIEIHYTALNFPVRERVKFKYKLEGFDDKWNEGDKGRVAHYTNLSPGEYTFRVKARNHDSEWSETDNSINIQKKSYFFQQGWVQILGFLLAAAGMIGIGGYLFRVRQIKIQKYELENIERIVKTINQATGIKNLLQSMLENAIQLFPQVDKGSFLLYDKDADLYRHAVQEGFDPVAFKNISFTHSEVVNRYIKGHECVEEGIYIVKDFENLFAQEKFISLQNPKSMLVMTLNLEDKLVGVLLLDNFTDPRAFYRSDIRKLKLFREHAVSAVAKAMAMEQLEAKVELRTTELLNANEALSQTNIELETIMEELRKTSQIAMMEREAAQAASRSKSEFLANMSHEIRTPMNAILGFSQLMETEITDEKQKRHLLAISTSGKNLLRLIDDILDFSRIEAGKLEIEPTPVKLSSILDYIKQIFDIKIQKKELALHIEVGGNIPEFLLLDGYRIRQVLINLVGNAVKFTPKGFIKVSVQKGDAVITSAGSLTAVDLVFSVQDTGIGIPDDQQEIILNPFQQQEGQKADKYGGTGLGLAICQRLIKLMGGKLTVRSEVGKGSTFSFTLENVYVSRDEAEEIDDFKPNVEDVRFKNTTVLVVDDEEYNRQLIAEYLTQASIDCIEAENGEDAVSKTKQFKPDLVLMDMKMPVMNGIEACKIIKADKELKNIPVIIVTAAALKEQRAKIKEACADHFLTKPVGKSDVIIDIMSFLSSAKFESVELEESPEPPESLETGDDVLAPEVLEKLPQLLKLLQGEDFTKRLETLGKTLILDDIEAFAEEMAQLDRTYRSGVLSRWAKELDINLQTFDPMRIQQTLSSFTGIVKEISALLT